MKVVFLSYNHVDKEIAAEVKVELEKAGFGSFLAHDDIEVSKIWREEILKHLDSCSALMAIVTENFASSVWVNQEVGAVMAKGKPIVSLIFAGSQRLPGFLEMFQGIPVSSINDAVRKSLPTITKGPEQTLGVNLSESEWSILEAIKDSYPDGITNSEITNATKLDGELVLRGLNVLVGLDLLEIMDQPIPRIMVVRITGPGVLLLRSRKPQEAD